MQTRILKITFLSLIFFLCINAQAQSVWSLKQCVDTALHNNLSIQQSSNTNEINQITLNQSKANLLPTLNGSAGQSFSSGRSLNPVNYQFTNGSVWSNNFSINGSISVFTGFQNSNTIKQNQLNYESSKYDVESMKNDIILSVVNYYLQVLFVNELVKNSQNQIELTTAQLERTKQLLDVGKKSESDLLQIKADLASKKLTLVNAQGQLKTAKLNIQQLMNITVQSSFDIEYPDVIEPEITTLTSTQELYSAALATQPTIKSSQLKKQSALYAIKISRGVMLPRLSLSGILSTNYSSVSKQSELSYLNSVQPIGYLQSNNNEMVLGNVSQPVYSYSNYAFGNQLSDNLSKSLSLSLTIPIFNSQTRYNIQKQKINFSNAELNEQVAKNAFRKNIEQAYTDVENGIAKYNAAKEQIDALTMSFQNANTKYNNQLMSATDLLAEKNKYTQAQSDFIQAKFELIFKMKVLDFYKGTLKF